MTAQRIEVEVASDGVRLAGLLTLPPDAAGIVLFAHGSGSSRLSPRNQFVADHLHRAGLATLLFDLLTREEEIEEAETRHLRFDIALLARRLTGSVDWTGAQDLTRALRIGLFGASTGAAAALVTAAQRSAKIDAVVSRGGRPDLAGDALPHVVAPTLLIVGALDTQVIELNRVAAARLGVEHRLEIVPGASHLFEEPGTLDRAATLAEHWFADHLGPPTRGC
jgi:putative phosphoribosyl transferase